MLNIAIAAEFELAEKIAECLEQSELAVEKLSVVEIYPFEDEQGIRFKNKSVAQLPVDDVDWGMFHYVFFAGEVNLASHLAKAADSGCVVIDVLGCCANLSDVPVVLPGLNDNQLSDLRLRNIVALPNPQVTQTLLALGQWIQTESLKQIMVTSLLPASYTNTEMVSTLAGQTAQLLNGIPLDEDQKRLAFDVFPLNPQNLSVQCRKIFPCLENILFHQIQVPVFYGMAQMVTLLAEHEMDTDSLCRYWQTSEWIHYHQDKTITPVTNGEMEVGEPAKLQISALSAVENGIEFWLVADEQRFNLAFMSVKLAEQIYLHGY